MLLTIKLSQHYCAYNVNYIWIVIFTSAGGKETPQRLEHWLNR